MEAAQRVCILQKTVHHSERQWHRIVIPGAQVPHFSRMQAEVKAQGCDIEIFVRDMDGSTTWRWGCRMSVMRPMVLDMGPFYHANSVQPGDTVKVFRHAQTNLLSVELERGTGAAAMAAGGDASTSTGPVPPAPSDSRIAASTAAAAAASAAFAAGQLPAKRWVATGKAFRVQVQSEGGGRRRRSHTSSEDEWEGGQEGGSDDMDYSPTGRSTAGRRGSGRGPLAVRRVLHRAAGGSGVDVEDSNEDSSDIVYTAAQTVRFDALVEAARMSQSP